MQAIQIEQNPKIQRNKSLDCSCEHISLSKCKKFYNCCEICSEKKFLRQISNPNCGLNDPFQM
jgi:hypothetical protein